MFEHDFTGVEDSGGNYPTLPEKQWFTFKIMEAEEQRTKKTPTRNMMKLRVEVVNDTKWGGVSLFHYVVFIPKGQEGEGISKHFMKSLGFDVEGKTQIDAFDWKGKRFKATTVVEEYEGKRSSKIKLVDSIDAEENANTTVKKTEEIPF